MPRRRYQDARITLRAVKGRWRITLNRASLALRPEEGIMGAHQTDVEAVNSKQMNVRGHQDGREDQWRRWNLGEKLYKKTLSRSLYIATSRDGAIDAQSRSLSPCRLGVQSSHEEVYIVHVKPTAEMSFTVRCRRATASGTSPRRFLLCATFPQST